MKSRKTIIDIICIGFVILWSYAAFSKLANLEKSHSEMLNQVFPVWIANIFYWLIPTLELSLCGLLLFAKTRRIGLYGSLFLMSSFTVYIAIVMTGIFGRVPCSCGGILNNMSYNTHLVFNLFFVVLALLGTIVMKRRTTFYTLNPFKRKEMFRHSE